MPILDSIGDFIQQTFFENILTRGPVAIYEVLTGKKRKTYTYKTERKQFIGFTSATKFILTWEKDIDHLKEKLNDGFDAENVRLSANNFQFIPLGNKTIIRPPESISFYMFHFLLQWLSAYKIKSAGIVETARASYTAYNDPNSEYIIGQTDRGQKFFISLTDDYSKRQFLRINKSIQTFDDFDIARLQSEIKHHG